MTETRYGLVEAGGTKFILGIASNKDSLGPVVRIDTTTPDETIGKMLDWFESHGSFKAFGVASFGPLSLDERSASFGSIGATPKIGWQGVDLGHAITQKFHCPVAIDTDVNGAALAEALWGAGKGLPSVIYFTVGTGIGAGAVEHGKIIHGANHSEMGHVPVRRHPLDLKFPGQCSFHGDCLEGLASGPAIMARWGASLSNLPQNHIAHDIIAYYLGQAVMIVQAILCPSRIIFGGGVMQTPHLLKRIQTQAQDLGAGYFHGDPSAMVTSPSLLNHSGLFGALALTQQLKVGPLLV